MGFGKKMKVKYELPVTVIQTFSRDQDSVFDSVATRSSGEPPSHDEHAPCT